MHRLPDLRTLASGFINQWNRRASRTVSTGIWGATRVRTLDPKPARGARYVVVPSGL